MNSLSAAPISQLPTAKDAITARSNTWLPNKWNWIASSKRVLPDAETSQLDSGHFAVEDSLDEIASNIHRSYDEKVSSVSEPTAIPKAAT